MSRNLSVRISDVRIVIITNTDPSVSYREMFGHRSNSRCQKRLDDDKKKIFYTLATRKGDQYWSQIHVKSYSPFQYTPPNKRAATMKTGPPTTLTVTIVVVAESA